MEEYLATIKAWAATFAPRGWAYCDGSLLAISSNSSLFSLLGTTYGGDGRTTFGLPDLRGRVPIGAGTGPGLTPMVLGQKGGYEFVNLQATQMPVHSHLASAADNTQQCTVAHGTTDNPAGNALAISKVGDDAVNVYTPSGTLADMASGTVQFSIGNTGGSQAHINMQPYQTTAYIICLTGLYPSRS